VFLGDKSQPFGVAVQEVYVYNTTEVSLILVNQEHKSPVFQRNGAKAIIVDVAVIPCYSYPTKGG